MEAAAGWVAVEKEVARAVGAAEEMGWAAPEEEAMAVGSVEVAAAVTVGWEAAARIHQAELVGAAAMEAVARV